MTRQARRGLTQKDRDDWSKVAEGTKPLHTSKPDLDHRIPAESEEDEIAPAPPQRMQEPIGDIQIGGKAGEEAMRQKSTPKPKKIEIDPKIHKKLKNGEIEPQRRIDLHGMTLAQAEPEVRRFIQDTHAQGLRLVLIITGKGKERDDSGPIPVRPGQLRRHVPEWLGLPPLSSLVLETFEAHPRHGGSGARYVYLRRKR